MSLWDKLRDRVSTRSRTGTASSTVPAAHGASGGHTAQAWRQLPPVQRMVTGVGLVTGPTAFPSTLASWSNPSFLAPLGHLVSEASPAGIAHGLTQPAPPDADITSPREPAPLALRPAVVQRATDPRRGGFVPPTDTFPGAPTAAPAHTLGGPADAPTRGISRQPAESRLLTVARAVDLPPVRRLAATPEARPAALQPPQAPPADLPQAAPAASTDLATPPEAVVNIPSETTVDGPPLHERPTLAQRSPMLDSAPPINLQRTSVDGPPPAVAPPAPASPTAAPTPAPPHRPRLGAPLSSIPATVQRHAESVPPGPSPVGPDTSRPAPPTVPPALPVLPARSPEPPPLAIPLNGPSPVSPEQAAPPPPPQPSAPTADPTTTAQLPEEPATGEHPSPIEPVVPLIGETRPMVQRSVDPDEPAAPTEAPQGQTGTAALPVASPRTPETAGDDHGTGAERAGHGDPHLPATAPSPTSEQAGQSSSSSVTGPVVLQLLAERPLTLRAVPEVMATTAQRHHGSPTPVAASWPTAAAPSTDTTVHPVQRSMSAPTDGLRPDSQPEKAPAVPKLPPFPMPAPPVISRLATVAAAPLITTPLARPTPLRSTAGTAVGTLPLQRVATDITQASVTQSPTDAGTAAAAPSSAQQPPGDPVNPVDVAPPAQHAADDLPAPSPPEHQPTVVHAAHHGSPPAAAGAHDTDELVRRLLHPLSRLLRDELRMGRERAGRRLDIRH